MRDNRWSGRVIPPVSLKTALVWIHVIVGAATLFICPGALTLRFLPGSASLLLVGAAVAMPYAVSAVYCHQSYTWQGNGPGRLRVVGFSAILIVTH
jgi:hypothetical protein